MERSITVEQANIVLYETKQTVTSQNLRHIASVQLNSSDFKAPITPDGGKVKFEVEYRKYWELEKDGEGMSLIRSDSCRIPIYKEPKT